MGAKVANSTSFKKGQVPWNAGTAKWDGKKYWKDRYWANREKDLAHSKKYYNEHKTEILAYSKKFHQENRLRDKHNQLGRHYGVTLEQYNIMFEKQNGLCAICKNPSTSKHQSGKIKDLSVDHNHATGKIRGLLCNHCNTAIGLMRENVVIMRNAIEYLEKETK